MSTLETCPECGAKIDSTARLVFLEGKGIHCIFSICAQCKVAMQAGAILNIVDSFALVSNHTVSAEAYKLQQKRK